jgi:hypothetical protein
MMESIKLSDLKKDVKFGGEVYKYLRMVLLNSERRNRFDCYEEHFLFVYRSACGGYVTKTAWRYDDFPQDFNEPSQPQKTRWTAKLINKNNLIGVKNRQEVRQ